MAVPKQKKSKAKVRARRGKISIQSPRTTICPKCNSPKIPHTVCKVCGTYKGREVIDLEKRKKRKERKLKAEQKETEEE